jgi:hypothetical protein
MRIAIYAQARSGSTALYNYIKDSLNLKGILEPYNPKFLNRFSEKEIWEDKNTVVKFLIRDADIVKKIPEKFDKVIYLTRDNDLEGAESLMYATKNDIWHESYTYTLSNKKNKLSLKQLINSRSIQKNYIKSQKGFQISYEDIFYDIVGIPKINNYININTDEFLYYLDIKNKYRKDKTNRNLI